ncbi:Oxygen-independent coproporphyrinogen-III oxidase [Staphylococcus aureus]|uniref:Oxygen-independent coproporphyrinogen-III oxidase n=1 Tax=Staphylococcus aureus TaxID=1280 RepID=A0A380E2D3_STAAU|nr:Oxygen-independent coproporphyrinogen-III oxidase [Staphylococcus aureus]
MFLGLRLNEGVSSRRFKKKFDQSIESVFGQTINNLKEKKLIVERTMRLHLQIEGKSLVMKFLKLS